MKRTVSFLLSLIIALSVCFSVPATATAAKTVLPESGHLDFSKSDIKKGNFKYEFKTIDHVEYCRKVFEDGYSTAYTVGVLFDTLEYAKTATEVNIVDEIDGIPVTEAGIEYQSHYIDSSKFSCYGYIINSDKTEFLFQRYYTYSDAYSKDESIGANVDKVTIPDSIKLIPAECFANMRKLKTVSLPKNLEKLGEYAFFNCTSLESVEFRGNKLTQIPDGTFSGCKSLKSIDFKKNKIELIGYHAFEECKSLKSVTLPSSLKSLGGYAFASSGLETITIPKNASMSSSFYLGANDWENDYVFGNCQSLKTVTFLGNKVTFCKGMFWRCDNLSVINLKNAKSVEITDSTESFSIKKNVLRINAKNKTVAKSIANQTEITHCKSFMGKKIRIYVDNELQYNIRAKEGHRYINVEARTATYFRNGNTAYKYCTICYKKTGYKFIPMLELEKPKITVTAGKGTVKVKYNAVKNATGFQLRYVNSKGKVVTRDYKTAKSMTVTLKKLPAGECKVYVRASRTVGNRTVYSSWRGRTVTVK